MVDVSFDDFLNGLTMLGGPRDEAAMQVFTADASAAAAALLALPDVTAESLADVVQQHPGWVPFLASCVGLGLEQLQRQLQHRLGTSGWRTLARRQPLRLVQELDRGFALVRAIQDQRGRQWTFGDILVERAAWSQRSASRSVTRGRRLEDVVEQILKTLGLPYAMRARFTGQRGQDAPCDFAIPAAGPAALIVSAVKGYDSTGSKLSDAVREIEQIAAARLPRQFVFAFVDGIGWRGRRADLRRIHQLWATRAIDGLYSLAWRETFQSDLAEAGRRLGLLR